MYNTESIALGALQFTMFVVCYGVARMICQPWMWQETFSTYMFMANQTRPIKVEVSQDSIRGYKRILVNKIPGTHRHTEKLPKIAPQKYQEVFVPKN